MNKKRNTTPNATHERTPTFLLELPLQVDSQQAKHLHGHFEAARQFYNALLSEALKRLRRLRADVRWQAARALPKTEKKARHAAFAALRKEYGFSEYALHAFAVGARVTWLADHLDSNTAQTLASRAYRTANRVCVGKANRVRFKSKGRGLDSLEGKSNKSGIRFVLQAPKEGHHGWLVWGKERYYALIDWHDPVVQYGLRHRIKYARLLRRKASSPRAQGADSAVPTTRTKLSQYCHGCGSYTKKPLSQRWHSCSCGIGPVQRDLYSAFLAAHLNLKTFLPSIAQEIWESAETRLRAAIEANIQRANDGYVLPRSRGIPCARARLPESLATTPQESCASQRRRKAWGLQQEPPSL